MNRAALLLAASLIATLSACSDPAFDENSQVGPNPALPDPKAFLMPPINVSNGVGWKDNELPTVAAGLAIKPLAINLAHPRFIYTLPNGDILVVQAKGPPPEPIKRPKDPITSIIKKKATSYPGGTKSASRITLIRDADGDGVPELVTTLVDKLNSPFGVAWIDNTLYVANTDGVVTYPYALGSTAEIKGAGKMLTPLPAGVIDHHWTKSLVLSPDGQRLYATVGSNSNIVENGFDAEINRAAILEIDRVSGRWRLFATGLRNPNSPVFYPGTNDLYVVVNERDEMGAHLVPDYMTRVQDGGFYGWPYSYYGQHEDPRIAPQDRRPDLVAKAIKPDYALGSHVAALGLAFSTSPLFPQYKGGAFIGEHGSWDRYSPSGYKVSFVPFVNGRPSGMKQDVVTGFRDADHGKSRGRPVGVALDKFGALLIADDVGNRVWRVTPAGGAIPSTAPPPPAAPPGR
ncbi:MAG: sorbosone dehydrogenase family protein [Sphingomicrobium sp.]